MADYIISHDDGHVTWLDLPTDITYDQMRAIIDGPLEATYPLGFEGNLFTYCNEEGRIFAAKVNPVITKLAASVYGYTQVGTFLFVRTGQAGDDHPLLKEDVELIFGMIQGLGYPIPTEPVGYDQALKESREHRR